MTDRYEVEKQSVSMLFTPFFACVFFFFKWQKSALFRSVSEQTGPHLSSKRLLTALNHFSRLYSTCMSGFFTTVSKDMYRAVGRGYHFILSCHYKTFFGTRFRIKALSR